MVGYVHILLLLLFGCCCCDCGGVVLSEKLSARVSPVPESPGLPPPSPQHRRLTITTDEPTKPKKSSGFLIRLGLKSPKEGPETPRKRSSSVKIPKSPRVHDQPLRRSTSNDNIVSPAKKREKTRFGFKKKKDKNRTAEIEQERRYAEH